MFTASHSAIWQCHGKEAHRQGDWPNNRLQGGPTEQPQHRNEARTKRKDHPHLFKAGGKQTTPKPRWACTAPSVSQQSCKCRRKIAELLVSETKEFNSASTFSLHYIIVLKVLRASKFANYIKRKKCPKLTTLHNKKRVEFAVRSLNRFAELKLTIFSDKKKFSLGGPDGCQFYYHDLRKEHERFSYNVAGDGSVMIWVALAAMERRSWPSWKGGRARRSTWRRSNSIWLLLSRI